MKDDSDHQKKDDTDYDMVFFVVSLIGMVLCVSSAGVIACYS